MNKLKITKSVNRYVLTDFFEDRDSISVGEMGNLIREGYSLDIRDTDGYSYNQETLVKIAFADVFPPNIKEEYVNVMAEFLDEADLLLVIENGGYDAFRQRRSRNSIFEGDYFFDKLDELVANFLKNGGDLSELNTYFNNIIKGIV